MLPARYTYVDNIENASLIAFRIPKPLASELACGGRRVTDLPISWTVLRKRHPFDPFSVVAADVALF